MIAVLGQRLGVLALFGVRGFRSRSLLYILRRAHTQCGSTIKDVRESGNAVLKTAY